ncbi:hypothetical protein ACS0TY_026877 [Phlomoides rotata]
MKAFVEAWDAACATSSTSRISGTIVAPNSTSLWDGRDASQWMIFKDVKGLKVDGFGCIDGRGKPWWDQSCRYHPKLALKFVSCNGSSVMNLKMTNSAQTHISVTACNGFRIQNVEIHSPGNSPNTDGIHFQASHHLSVTDSTISTGDDCISIGDYLSNIKVSNIACGPGHGISIGSLGKSGNYVRVKNIRVSNSIFNGTTNGARIKTWQVGRGYVKNVRFENLVFHSVKNPIIIDQNYCDIRDACEEKESGVGISNVVYKDIYGTSTTKIAIDLNCSRWVPCTGILMDSIHLTSTQAGTQLNAQCTSAYGRQINVLPPASCLLEE